MVDLKSKPDVFTGKIIGWSATTIICGWAVMYLYFLSSSQVPLSVYDYAGELALKKITLQKTLSQVSSLNPQSSDLIRIHQMLSINEICLGDFQAAEKNMLAALPLAQAKLAPAGEDMVEIYLKSANLSRDMNQFDLAKINYKHSLNYLHQIAFSPQFNEVKLNNAAINFNNLAVLYFLMAEKTINLKERQKYYLTAKDYFVQAKHLMLALDSSNQCLLDNTSENLKQCLTEIKFLR